LNLTTSYLKLIINNKATYYLISIILYTFWVNNQIQWFISIKMYKIYFWKNVINFCIIISAWNIQIFPNPFPTKLVNSYSWLIFLTARQQCFFLYLSTLTFPSACYLLHVCFLCCFCLVRIYLVAICYTLYLFQILGRACPLN